MCSCFCRCFTGLPVRVAAENRLRFHVDHFADLGRFRRIDDLSRLIEYADAVNGLLPADAADALLDPLPVVVQHVVPHVRLEVFTVLLRMPFYLREQAPVFGLDIEVSKNAITTRIVSATPKVSFRPILLLSIDHPSGAPYRCESLRFFAGAERYRIK